jgi:hypothetical protein
MKFSSEENSCYGNKNHIKSSYKSDLAGSEVKEESVLLKVTAEKKRNTAAKAADKHIFECELFLFTRGKFFVFTHVFNKHKRNKNNSADECSYAVEGESSDTCAFTLSNERKTPYNSGKNAVKRAEKFAFVIDKITS